MFTNKLITKPQIKLSLSEEGNIVYSHYINLPKNYVLFVSRNENTKETCFKKYSIHELGKVILEKTYEGEYHFLGVMPDHSVLFNCYEPKNGDSLVRLCSRTFEILSNNEWERGYSIGIINNSSFFVLEPEVIFNTNTSYILKIYQWDESKLLQQGKRIGFPIHLPGIKVSEVHALSQTRYCCGFYAGSPEKCGYLVFDIDFEKNFLKTFSQINESFLMDVNDQLGRLLVLPNGNILLYHPSLDVASIVDGETLAIKRNWSWYENGPENFLWENVKITAFPDSIHLLLNAGSHLYIFNTETFVSKEIQLKNITPLGNHHILPNGQLLAFFGNKINVLNINEMLSYKRKFDSYVYSYYLSHLIFKNIAGLAKETRNQILSQAFTAESKADFMARPDHEIFEEKNLLARFKNMIRK